MMLGGASQFNVFPLEGEKKIFFFNTKSILYWGIREDPLEKETATHSSTLAHGESHGGRSLVGYIPWGRKESDTTERLHFTHIVD